VLVSPIAIAALQLALDGDYASQRILWRSSPGGVDISTLVLGPPQHALLGGYVHAVYQRLGISAVEQSAYLGLVPLAVIAYGIRSRRYSREDGIWMLAFAVFGIVALGPFLRVAAAETGIVLPDAVLRCLPLASNARIPGRAIVVAQITAAMLCALALARTTRHAIRVVCAVLIARELLPAPVSTYPVPQRDSLAALLAADAGAGAVIELPTGHRDGFGEVGRFDHGRWFTRPITGDHSPVGSWPGYHRVFPRTIPLRDCSTA
jgi:hypothetical protein